MKADVASQNLNQMLKGINSKGHLTFSDPLRVMALARQLLEGNNLSSRYPHLNLYCNWCLHVSISKSETGFSLLEQLTDVLLADPSDVVVAVSRQISLGRMRSELGDIFRLGQMPTNLTDDDRNWQSFCSTIIGELVNKPVEYPIGVENTKGIAFKSYRRSLDKSTAMSREGLMAVRLFLSDDIDNLQGRVESPRKGEVHWIVTTKPGYRISGPLIDNSLNG